MQVLRELGLLLVLSLAAQSEVVPFQYCSRRSSDHCKITNVQVNPCKEASQNEPCKINIGQVASIAFDFETDFDINNEPKTRFYKAGGFLDLPFVGMDTNVCKMTNCPITKNTVHHFNYTLFLEPFKEVVSTQTIDTKIRVWEDKGPREKECCFIFKLRLINKSN